MQLRETLLATGMDPPHTLIEGRWLRFPGIGKGRSNRSGWCRVISPTLAIYGDWSSGLSAVWYDGSQQNTEESKRLLQEARRRECEYRRQARLAQSEVAQAARTAIKRAMLMEHPYLARKGFLEIKGLVLDDRLLIPMRDVTRYEDVINVQQIWPDATKRFLPGGRAGGAIHRIGSSRPKHVVLCEGYATGLSINAALGLISSAHAVVVCFSANNLTTVAHQFPGAIVAADHDQSRTGEEAAKRTGLKWAMPDEVGDFNDLHQKSGLFPVMGKLRGLLS